MTLSKKPWTYPNYDVTHKTTQIQNFPNFFIENTRLSESLEGLNSSIAQSAGKLWPSGKIAKVTFGRSCFFTKFLFFGHNF